VYNMYSWDQSARTADEHADAQPTESHAARNGHAHPGRNGQDRAGRHGQPALRRASAETRHAQAVQFSLDRRDNGGDAGRTR
jgi:hypothetical protein